MPLDFERLFVYPKPIDLVDDIRPLRKYQTRSAS